MDHPTVDHGHGVTRPRRKPPRRRCRPTSSLGRSDRPLALLLSSLFFCSETLLSRFLVASQPLRDLLICAKHLFVAANKDHGISGASGAHRNAISLNQLASAIRPASRVINVSPLIEHDGLIHFEERPARPSASTIRTASMPHHRMPRTPSAF